MDIMFLSLVFGSEKVNLKHNTIKDYKSFGIYIVKCLHSFPFLSLSYLEPLTLDKGRVMGY